MYVLKPISERVQRIREKYRTTVPRIDISRYKLVTEFYMENQGMTGSIKRARAMKYIYDNMPVRVEDDDVIVGALGTTFRSAAFYPELGMGSLPADIKKGNMPYFAHDPYTINPEDGEYVLSTTDFWMKECVGAKIKHYTVDGFLPFDNSGTTTQSSFPSSGPVGHFCTGYNRAIRVGLGAIKAEADAKMRQLEDDGIFGDSINKYHFYKSISLVCEGMIGYIKRYAAEVRRMLEKEQRPARRAELEKMAECLEWTLDKPARNYMEAVQCLFFYQICLALEGNLHGMSYGRIDQYLGDYYQRDVENGVITPEYGQEILDLFYLKVAEMNKYWGDCGEMGVPGYTSGQLMTLGGVDADGNDATNEVTYMMLQASGRLKLHDPPQALRVHEGTPDKLWEAAIETTKINGGVPSFESDKAIIPALMSRGLSLQSARNYCIIGCVEPGGCGDEWPACGGTGGGAYINLANCVWLAINNGRNPLPVFSFIDRAQKESTQTGLSTGYLYEMNSMDEVFEAYKKQVEFFLKWHVSLTNNFEYYMREIMPLPAVSATMDGCMENGADVMWGGARFNSTGMAGVGLGNVADSLQMIEHLCFETKKCTTRELYDALVHNWEGYDDLLNYIKYSAPHSGNNDPKADRWVGPAAKVVSDYINQCTGPRGRWSAGMWPVVTHIMFGAQTAATPDGRKKGEPLADGVSPVQQMDTNGPTAVIASVGQFKHSDFPNGTLCNMKFHPTAVAGEDGIAKFANLMKTFFFDYGGMELQLNMVSSETMRDAQQHPENYRDLVVRIAGFSVYFVEMSATGQRDLIRRTELTLG